MRAFFHINGIQGDGTDESPFRPFHIDNLTGWAAYYKTNASESLVLAEVENPASFSELEGVTFIGLLTDLQNNTGNLRSTVESTLQSFANIEKANWGDTMVGQYLRRDEITDEEYAIAVTAYTPWEVNKSYKVGDLCSYQATLYEVVQAHTSQLDWTPNIVPALFTAKSPEGIIPLWVQPLGAQDAYALGALVIFDGQIYESLINANVWSPAVYPAGWKVR